MKSSTRSLTEGPLAKQILLVSLPLALSNLLQVLFNMSDVAVVGRFAGSTALGAVGSTSIFVTLSQVLKSSSTTSAFRPSSMGEPSQVRDAPPL